MINNKRTCEVATHFNITPHDLSYFKFIGIEQIVIGIEQTLLRSDC